MYVFGHWAIVQGKGKCLIYLGFFKIKAKVLKKITEEIISARSKKFKVKKGRK